MFCEVTRVATTFKELPNLTMYKMVHVVFCKSPCYPNDFWILKG